jgi:hypothetical protein
MVIGQRVCRLMESRPIGSSLSSCVVVDPRSMSLFLLLCTFSLFLGCVRLYPLLRVPVNAHVVCHINEEFKPASCLP